MANSVNLKPFKGSWKCFFSSGVGLQFVSLRFCTHFPLNMGRNVQDKHFEHFHSRPRRFPNAVKPKDILVFEELHSQQMKITWATLPE